MSSETHPLAVAIARAVLVVAGMIALALGIGVYFSGAAVPAWKCVLSGSFGALLLLSACFESASGVVATVMIFFYPLS